MNVSRPAIRYFGGKWNIAPWVISFFPKHLNYVEPCGGGASVLLRKERSELETYNDIDGNVVNFFRVLRDQPEELIYKLELTPYSREEYEISFKMVDDPVERARRFFVVSIMGIIPTVNENFRPSLRTCRLVNNSKSAHALPFLRTREYGYLLEVSDRLLGVQIENDPFDKVITNYDNEDSLIYFDPPYTVDTRTESGVYLHEWIDKDHVRAADLLRYCKGCVVISGYANEMYEQLYEQHGWKRHDKLTRTNMGGENTESVWLSPRTVKALNQPKQGNLLEEL